ncbi:MAG: anthranilate synthase component II [Candidatus Dormibacteria bacterium]
MSRPRVVVIDNYDSFTFNLVQYLRELGAVTDVVRNDARSVASLVAARPDLFVLSPGPGRPEDAGVCADLVRAAAESRLPLLGVCLGHQAIAIAFGAVVDGAPTLMHGKCSDILHDGRGVFAGVPSPMRATRYHSLVAVEATLPPELEVSARTADGVVMGVRHTALPIEGVQFHPESIGTPHGIDLLANMLGLAAGVPGVSGVPGVPA